MPEGNELAQCPGVRNEPVECVSLRKLRYVRRRSCVRSADALVLERLHKPPGLAASSMSACGTKRTCRFAITCKALKTGRAQYAHDPYGLIAASHVVAVEFATIAAANN